ALFDLRRPIIETVHVLFATEKIAVVLPHKKSRLIERIGTSGVYAGIYGQASRQIRHLARVSLKAQTVIAEGSVRRNGQFKADNGNRSSERLRRECRWIHRHERRADADRTTGNLIDAFSTNVN